MSVPPKLFVSYSWSTPEHEQWVIELATEVRASGVDVMLDKWDLREGHDAVAFMERMVTDASIAKVLIVCDHTYSTKADDRSGGVGTETQIISREVYERQSQDKFVAVVAEKDETGRPYLPTYYKSRIYIDLSESERYAENFEKLLRWIFDKPLYIKPEIGSPPSYLADSNAQRLGTSARAKRAVDGLRNDRAYARGALDEYLTAFAENLEKLRLPGGDEAPHDLVVKSIDEFIPSRSEFLQVLVTLSQYGDAKDYGPRLHRFFESLIPYLSRPEWVDQWKKTDFDNFKFIVHEMFLYTMALLVRDEHFDAAVHLFSQPYYAPGNPDYGGSSTVSYTIFHGHMKSLELRNQIKKLNRLSLRADLLEERARTAGIPFRYLMQADFICFLRADLGSRDPYHHWWPETLLYADRHYGPFEVFARSISKVYLARTLPLLGVSSLEEVKARLDVYVADRASLPRWQFESFNPAVLLGFDLLGTRE